MAETNAAPGDRIATYVLDEQLGTGMGTVRFRAHDEATGRVAVVKILLDPAMAADAGFRMRFQREARAIAAVAEPHIVPVYGAGEAGGLLYIATQFVFGTDLAALLRPVSATLAPARAATLIAGVAAALDAAHAVRLVHHSVTPANILISSFPGRPEHAYLSDFGLAKLTADFRIAHYKEEVPLGDPDYRAPEQVHGDSGDGGAAGGLADQYSLACIAFRMLTGTVPFGRPSPQATALAHVYQTRPRITLLRAELPAAVDAVLARAMARDPADRYPTCGHFAAALRDALPLLRMLRLPGMPGLLRILRLSAAIENAAVIENDGATENYRHAARSLPGPPLNALTSRSAIATPAAIRALPLSAKACQTRYVAV